MNRWTAVCVTAERAYGADGKLEWALDLSAIGCGRIELGRSEYGAQGLAYVAVGLQEDIRDVLYKRRAWIVGDEAAREFRCNEFRCRRMMRENVQHHQTIFDAAACWNLVTQHNLLAIVVQAR